MGWILVVMGVFWWVHALLMQRQVDLLRESIKVTSSALFMHLAQHEEDDNG